MERKAQIIALANQKGGVGKTTTCHVMAYGLCELGYKVLALDLDSQENLTDTFDAYDEERNIYRIFKKEKTVSECIRNIEDGLDYIAGSECFAGADMEFYAPRREFILREALEEVQNDYDYILIDTPPALGILTINALTASDYVIIPACARKYSVQGMAQLSKTVEVVQRGYNQKLKIAGILITQYDGRATIRQQIQEALRDIMAKRNVKVYESTIRVSCKVEESQYQQADLLKKYPNEDISKDYRAFIQEFLGQSL